jgi:peptidoglycan/xylan/chitin deacetylase (PgdA/CDA1 family)
MRKKEILAGMLRSTGVTRAATYGRRRTEGEVTILAYHRILPVRETESYPFDVELISADPQQFDWQMAWVSRNFPLVSVSGIADCIEGRKPIPAGAVAVTFDDGFVDNYTHAFPVLRRHGIPACIFLSTGYVGTRETYWFEAIARLAMTAPVRSIRDESSGTLFPSNDDESSRRNDLRSLLSRLKRMPDNSRRISIDRMLAQVEGPAESPGEFSACAMDWSQVREMSQAGIEFGSHGVSHAVLSRLEPADLRTELAASRMAIENATRSPVVAIAYPVGGEDSIGTAVVTAAIDAGYRLGFTYLSGANRVARADRMRLGRQHVERYTSRGYYQGLLAFPSVFD